MPSLPRVFDSMRLPVIAAPLFIISTPKLVIAQCKAGIVGSFPALNARPQPELDGWLTRIQAELAALPVHGYRIEAEKRTVTGIVGTRFSQVLSQADLEPPSNA